MELMLEPARERLKKYSVAELIKKSGVSFDEEASCFIVRSLGQDIHISYPDFIIREKLDMWHHLTILQYMDTADGETLTNDYISLSQMPGALSRGLGYDKDLETMFVRYFSDVSEDRILWAVKKLDGKLLESGADISAIFTYASRFMVKLNLYLADEEFPASGKCLVDQNAHHYLTIEAAGGACSAVVMRLVEVIHES